MSTLGKEYPVTVPGRRTNAEGATATKVGVDGAGNKAGDMAGGCAVSCVAPSSLYSLSFSEQVEGHWGSGLSLLQSLSSYVYLALYSDLYLV